MSDAVIDASAIVEVMLRTTAGAVLRAELDTPRRFHAPHVLDIEVLHTLRRLTLTRKMTDDQARSALDAYRVLAPIVERHSHETLIERVWSLRHNVSAYDAVYVALTDLIGATLVTADRRLASAAVTAGVEVDLLPIR